MAIALVGSRQFYDGSADTTTHAFSFTVGAGASLLVVKFTSEEGASTISEVRWGGAAGTLLTQGPFIAQGAAGRTAAIYYLINPTVQTADVYLAFSGNAGIGVEAIALSGTDTTTPIADSDTGGAQSGTDCTTPELTPSGSDNWLETCLCLGNAAATATTTGTATETNEAVISGGLSGHTSAHSFESGISAGVTPGWTASTSGAWGVAAALFAPGAGGPAEETLSFGLTTTDAEGAEATLVESIAEAAAFDNATDTETSIAPTVFEQIVLTFVETEIADSSVILTEDVALNDIDVAAAAEVDESLSADGSFAATLVGDIESTSGPTPVADLNTNTALAVNTTYLIRGRVKNIGSAAGETDFRWVYNHAALGWLPITPTSAEVKAVAASTFANDDDVPEVIGGPGTYLVDNNAATEDGTTTIGAALPVDGTVEFVLAFQIDGAFVANAETGTIKPQVFRGGVWTDLDSYTNVFTYTVFIEAVVEALAFGLVADDADVALAALAADVPAGALEAATAQVAVSALSGATAEGVIAQDSAVAAASAMEAIAAGSVLDDTAIGDTASASEIVAAVDLAGAQAAVAAASEATTADVISQDSASAAADLMEAIAAGSVLDDTAIGDTATATEIVEAVNLSGTQVAAASLAADAPTGDLGAATAQTAVSALSGVSEEALAAGDAQAAIAAASGATTAAALFDEAAIGDTAGAVGIVAAVDLAGAQVALAALDGVVPASASFAADQAALGALTEALVAPSALASDQAADAALTEAVAVAATLAADHAALSELSGAVTVPAAFAESSTSDTEGVVTLEFGAALDDVESAIADLMDALTATAFLSSSTQGDTASSRSVSFAIDLEAAQSATVARVAALAEPMVAEVAAAEVADFAAVQAEPIVVQIAAENAVAGFADLTAGVDFGSAKSSLVDLQMSLDVNATFGVVALSGLGTHITVTMELALASIMESTPHYIDPILGARFGVTSLTAKHVGTDANLSARFQY